MNQENLFDIESDKKPSGPVECLGMTFESDEARRAHFSGLLSEKLQDPEFRAIEGFPIGTDEAILELSDPPYYTACPNPWLNDFIDFWQSQKEESGEDYHREPFAADVSEGKQDPVYKAHSYHTKVPHKAIMRYILHYTNPGEIIYDGFCGTGMAGVAAQLCGDRKTVESLGYQVRDDGLILEKVLTTNGQESWSEFSKLGARRAILNDLSPTASFISHNYTSSVDLTEFERKAKSIIADVEEECGWMYETFHSDGISKGKVHYTVWSDVFICSECNNEVVFWDSAIDSDEGKVKDIFQCGHCAFELNKKGLEKSWISTYDYPLQKTVSKAKQVPVLIKYTVPGIKGGFTKTPALLRN